MLTINEEITNFSQLLAANLKNKKIAIKHDSLFLELDRTMNNKETYSNLGLAIANKLYPEILIYKSKIIPCMNRVAKLLKENIENAKIVPESSTYRVEVSGFSFLVTELIQSGYSLADGPIEAFTNKEALNLPVPSTGLRSIFTFSNPKYNIYLQEILSNHNDEELERIYSLYLNNICSLNENIPILFTNTVSSIGNLNKVILVLAAVDYYLNNRPAELVEDALYVNVLTQYQYNLVRTLKTFHTLYDNIKTAKRVILYKENHVAYVDNDLFKEYQQQGGTSDAILGWLVSDGTVAASNQTIRDLIVNKEMLEETWRKFVTASKLNITDQLLERIYGDFVISFNKLWNEYIPEELKDDMDVEKCEELFTEFVRNNKSIILKPALFSRLLMSDVFFTHTNFKLFSETMVNYLVTHNDISHQDAATYAILDMIVIYLTTQLTIE